MAFDVLRPAAVAAMAECAARVLVSADGLVARTKGFALLAARRSLLRDTLLDRAFLDAHVLALAIGKPLPQLLVQAAVFCPEPEPRQRCVAALEQYLLSFAPAARAELYVLLLSDCPFPTMVYQLVLWLKGETQRELACPPGSRHFSGPEAIATLLRAALGPPEEVLLDVEKDYDRLAAITNWVHFLCGHGSPDLSSRVAENETGVWSAVALQLIRGSLLTPLRKNMAARLAELRHPDAPEGAALVALRLEMLTDSVGRADSLMRRGEAELA